MKKSASRGKRDGTKNHIGIKEGVGQEVDGKKSSFCLVSSPWWIQEATDYCK